MEKIKEFENQILQEDLESVLTSNIPLSMLESKVILVTGATGLVGSMIIRSLLYANIKLQLNIKVLAVIRNEEKAKQIYGELIKLPEFKLIVNDIRNNIIIEENVDYIYHCASITTSKIMIEKPVETLLTAVEGTKNLLELAVEKKVKSFVYVSSMEMYGKTEDNVGDVKETDLGYIDPLAVRSNYPESKRLCENMCIAYMEEYGVPIKIARLAQTFGAGILPGENRVFAQFARSVINKKDIILHTEGKSEGNYCYTRDMVEGIILILLKGKNGEAYNVSNPITHTTIANMAEMVANKIANGKIKVVYDIPETNTFGYAADTKMKLNSDKLMKLGWEPKVNLEEAYRRLILSLI